ncbi:AraC family transcriptional regulator [Niveispirillum sp. KHB5.9]|uniref:AraC family transcriptional regulator n=1 Tax=Niveispirillum sp. KHB5.9 TaxID=3400269 RepID=UPI003A86A8E4
MDPLSDILSLLKPRNLLSAGFEAGGDWAVQFPDQQDNIKTGAIVAGRCLLWVDGVDDPVQLEQGDCFLLPSGRPFRMASGPGLPALRAEEIFPAARRGGILKLGEATGFFCVSSRFSLEGRHGNILLGMLPPIVHLKEAPDLRWAMERMMAELREDRPGAFLVLRHLAHMMLVQALRLHLAMGPGQGTGWLFALSNQQVGAAIGALHADPARAWTLQDLARHAGMSRSSFAERFKTLVGAAPMEYLTRWRMLLAGDRLLTGREPVSAIALSVGYQSESAFSTAFKRVLGCPPRDYARMAIG